MMWVVTNQINRTKHRFHDKATATAFCRNKALDYEKAQKYLGIRRPVGYEQVIAVAVSEDGAHSFTTRVKATVVGNDGTPTKWRIIQE